MGPLDATLPMVPSKARAAAAWRCMSRLAERGRMGGFGKCPESAAGEPGRGVLVAVE